MSDDDDFVEIKKEELWDYPYRDPEEKGPSKMQIARNVVTSFPSVASNAYRHFGPDVSGYLPSVSSVSGYLPSWSRSSRPDRMIEMESKSDYEQQPLEAYNLDENYFNRGVYRTKRRSKSKRRSKAKRRSKSKRRSKAKRRSKPKRRSKATFLHV